MEHVTQTQPNNMYWQKKSAYILKRVEAFDYAGNDVAPPAKKSELSYEINS